MYCMNCGAELPKDVSFDTESSCFSNNWKAGAFILFVVRNYFPKNMSL